MAHVVHQTDAVLISDAMYTEEHPLADSHDLHVQDTEPDGIAVQSDSEPQTDPQQLTFAPPELDTSPPTLVAPRRAEGVHEIPHRAPGPTQQPRELHLVVLLGRVKVSEYRFHSGVIAFGRDPRQDVVLDNPSVSRLHCKIRISEGGAVLEDMNTPNGTVLNRRDVRRARLQPGDEIGVGKFTVLFRPSQQQLAVLDALERAPASAMQGDPLSTTFLSISEVHRVQRDQAEEHGAHLKVMGSGGRLGRRIPLARGTTVLGASFDADVPLSGWFINPRHALIVKRGQGYRLVHSAGIRPVWVNGRPVKEWPLRNRDQIRIGSNTFSFFADI